MYPKLLYRLIFNTHLPITVIRVDKKVVGFNLKNGRAKYGFSQRAIAIKTTSNNGLATIDSYFHSFNDIGREFMPPNKLVYRYL